MVDALTDMSEPTVVINPEYELQTFRIGRERTPVLVIDDLIKNIDEVIEFARSSSSFEPDKTSGYPGVRAKLERSYVVSVLNLVYPLLYKMYSIPRQLRLRPKATFYSLVAKPEADLLPLQCVPHFDSNHHFYFATVHYLNPGSFGGTGFFRHRPTGYENIWDSRCQPYVDSADAFIQKNGLPEQRYIGGSNEHYELYDQVDYKENRFVAYPGTLLHSALINPSRDINPDPRSGRLTANIFVDFE